MKTLILTAVRFFIVKFKCCLIVLLFSVCAQAAVAAPLPAEAQESINKGILAGKQNDHRKAIDHFQEARKFAPNAPELFFYLGVAESKIPGRELRAMAWFGAYLESSPNSANAAKVRKQIKELYVRNQLNITRLIRAAEDAAKQFGEDRDDNLRQVAVLWAESGDFEMAIQTADSIQHAHLKSQARVAIAQAQAKVGDIAGALKTADGIPMAQEAIAIAQAKAGDIAGAQKTVDSISDALKHVAQSDIVKAQVTAGDIAGAKKTADNIQNAFTKSVMQSSIATAQAEAGDIAGARKTAASIDAGPLKDWAEAEIAGAQAKAGDMAGARKTVDNIQDDVFKNSAQVSIIGGQAKAGNIARAKKSADSIQDPYYKIRAQSSIAEAQAEAGDFAGAKKTADRIQDDVFKNSAQAYIAGAQARAGDIAGAKKTANNIQNTEFKSRAQSSIAKAMAKKNSANLWVVQNPELLNAPIFLDIGAYLKSLSPGNAQEAFDGLCAAARKMVEARQMLNLNASN